MTSPDYKRTVHIFIPHTAMRGNKKFYPHFSSEGSLLSINMARGKDNLVGRKFSRRCRVVPRVEGGVQISFFFSGVV